MAVTVSVGLRELYKLKTFFISNTDSSLQSIVAIIFTVVNIIASFFVEWVYGYYAETFYSPSSLEGDIRMSEGSLENRSI